MAEIDSKWLRNVYRLRGVPFHVETLSHVAKLLSSVLKDVSQNDIDVKSLAITAEWEIPLTKIATLQLRSVPAILSLSEGVSEWCLSSPFPHNGLILDCHFLGFTPLNDVDSSKHTAWYVCSTKVPSYCLPGCDCPLTDLLSCIAISGLSSHPFGSWQPHAPDKSFMWIRDEMPSYLPGVRNIIYGHDSRLVDSASNQTIRDMSREFIDYLRIGNFNLPSAKPLVFLAHSLGGLILKDAMVQIAGAADVSDSSILERVRGAVMFGVPNLGMEQSHLLAIVDGQPNETLIEDLSRGSQYLSQLDKAFSGIIFERDIKVFWGYETVLSHTVIRSRDDTKWIRDGPLELLVSSHSATCRLDLKQPAMVFPIQADHSDMVKFTRKNTRIKIICQKLSRILYREPLPISEVDPNVPNPSLVSTSASSSQQPVQGQSVKAESESETQQKILQNRYEGTLEWIFEQTHFTDWLQYGSGIFWINGKPGSGKSTLMKFVVKDDRTQQLLHDWKRGAIEIQAHFFFNYRGSPIERSMGGVLRSLTTQILSRIPQPLDILKPYIQAKEGDKKNAKWSWSVHELEEILRTILRQTEHPLDICLFFDALDEFQGHIKLINRFLKDLLSMSLGSTTRVKICFSSRPWEIFQDSFSECPNLSVQEFTATDIRNYCGGIISTAKSSNLALYDLIPDIVHRAKGVFLWVRLVTLDLLRSIASHQHISLTELRAILAQLPQELNEYYEQIISRLASNHRWEAYALLDLVVRASERESLESSLEYIVGAAMVAECAFYPDALRMLRTAARMSLKDQMGFIASRSGGLLEVYKAGTHLPSLSGIYVQVMHQTVFEFVTSLRFKEVVLGKASKIIWENGHSFHVKYLAATYDPSIQRPSSSSSVDKWLETKNDVAGQPVPTIFDHARLSEFTSGRSQWSFLSSVPPDSYKIILEKTDQWVLQVGYKPTSTIWSLVATEGFFSYEERTSWQP
ncbi:hypothetical protein HJFPF1_10418 [Paramyrothecium foliicola]|nr:hypothetical protein HJFPF1_10418 [Paramyrothecium foliicola]